MDPIPVCLVYTIKNICLDFILANHPVHIVTRNNQLSPSAFIPFCEFGGNMSAMGKIIDQFDVPVCNSFQAKILNDQLCYEVDLDEFSDKNNIDKELDRGFAFIMDYNEDRQVGFDQDINIYNDEGLVDWLSEATQEQTALIYLNTIGNE